MPARLFPENLTQHRLFVECAGHQRRRLCKGLGRAVRAGILIVSVTHAGFASTHAQGTPLGYEQGILARQAGQFESAADNFEAAIATDPNNSDAWLQLGLCWVALDRWAQAEQAFETTLQLAPEYADAAIGLARIAYFRGQYDLARERLGGHEAIPAAAALRLQIDRAEQARQDRPWRIDIAVGHSDLTQDLPDWREGVVAVGYRLNETTSLGAVAEYASRFGDENLYVQARVDRRVGTQTNAYVAIGAAPDASFRPKLALRTGAVTPLSTRQGNASGLYATFDGSIARYQAGAVTNFSTGLRYLFANDALRVGGRLISLVDENDTYRNGYAVDTAWQAAPNLRLIGSYTDAPETSDGVTLDVKARTFGLRYAAAPDATFQIHLLNETRSAYERTAVVIGWSTHR